MKPVLDRRVQRASGAEDLIVQLNAAMNVGAMYPVDHPRVGASVDKLIASLDRELDLRGHEEIGFLVVGQDVVIDQQPLRRRAVHLQAFAQTLRRRGLEGLTLVRGLQADECRRFIETMAGSAPPQSSPHVVVGRLRIAVESDAPEAPPPGLDLGRGGGLPASPRGGLTSARLEEGREAFVRLRGERLAGVEALERLVWDLVDSLVESIAEIYPLAPLRHHDELTYLHSVNVSTLVLAMGRAFGYQGQLLHDLGMAALLHDLGKLSIPSEFLTRPGPLNEEEWKLMKLHPELGTQHICELEMRTPLAAVVAYEHHLRFDGKPNYPLLATPRPPTLASRMTAVADNYDAMTGRVQPRALEHEEALTQLRGRAGTYLDPLLVGSFCTLFAR
jgi:hypothetical protein